MDRLLEKYRGACREAMKNMERLKERDGDGEEGDERSAKIKDRN